MEKIKLDSVVEVIDDLITLIEERDLIMERYLFEKNRADQYEQTLLSLGVKMVPLNSDNHKQK